MKQRASSLPVLVVVAVVALVLGSIGTAVAGPALTQGKVKKIAAKVVFQKAPTLSVASAASAANAANADNAANLAGKPASSYLNQATVYTSSNATPATNRNIAIPLAPGSYTIGYSVVLAGGSGYSYCQLRRTRGAVITTVADQVVETPNLPTISGYGAVTVLAGDLVTVRCNSSTAFQIPALQPAQIVVTPVDTVTVGTPLAASRGTAGRGD